MAEGDRTIDIVLTSIQELKNSNNEQERELKTISQKVENYHVATIQLMHATEEKCQNRFVSIKEINAIRGLIVVVGILTTLITTIVAFASGK